MNALKTGAVMAEIAYGKGKFDVNEKNSDFRNLNNAKAAISKIYSPIAIYISVMPEFNFANLANELELPVILPFAPANQKENIVAADVYVKTGATADDITAAINKLEATANSEGYAFACQKNTIGFYIKKLNYEISTRLSARSGYLFI
jgi:hypothetical protein